ncbi:Adenylate cyclase [hydrothermal vent metagenome]|uniref:Adenylate cyclase n=1 Tax=hydrothermal vent metagenome TaxID=652676 RepID=A0A3B1B0Z0_9ZZZZ
MKWQRINRLVQAVYHFVYRSKGRFYLYLAFFCSVLVVLDATTLHLVAGMQHRTFDLIMKNRITYQAADPNVVIVDIDEGSLEAMAKEYGRWPWPRQIFAEFVENLQEQQPKAIIFDILFSDQDVYNKDSDEYFNEVVAGTDNTFFPMLRLNPQNDELSKVTPAMIPGMSRIAGEPQQDKGLALILPHFPAIVESGRVGTNNIYPDKDGIVRQYSIFREHYGWSIPSLPARIGEVLGWTMPDEQDVLLNWRGGLDSFKTARFSDVYEDFMSRKRQRPQDEFTDKIVIIGSSAPSLFDTKPTPMERVHPGVEVLATAVDNIKNGDWVTSLSNPWIYISVALSLIWLVALAFLTGIKRSLIDGVFTGSQVGLVALSFASLNLSTYFIDLTAPITAGFIFFSLARVYAYAEVALAERRVWLKLDGDAKGWQHTLVVALLLEGGAASESKIVTGLKRRLNARKEGFTIEAFPDKPAGISRAYGDLLLIYYVDSVIVDKYPQESALNQQILALVEEEVATVCGLNQENLPLGSCYGAMPYGDDTGRVGAWRKLVTNAIHNLHDAEGGLVFTGLKEKEK